MHFYLFDAFSGDRWFTLSVIAINEELARKEAKGKLPTGDWTLKLLAIDGQPAE